MFFDETSVYTNAVRTHARAPRGQRAYGPAPVQRKRLTILGALSRDGILAAMSIAGSAGGDVVLAYAQQVLLPQMRPGQVLVLDNFVAHRTAALREAVAAAGCTLLYLPRYSPEYNPIELAWSKLKALLRRAELRTTAAIEAQLGALLDQITAEDAHGYFRHAGYKPAPDP